MHETKQALLILAHGFQSLLFKTSAAIVSDKRNQPDFISVLSVSYLEVTYVTTGNSAFRLALYLTGAHFRGELQHAGDVSEQKIMC